jgi:hypothetical protein
MPQNFDITRILSLGTIGLGFLLAFLAFRLLSKEQSMDRPREGILRATNRFMIFSLALCVIGLSSELYRAYRTTPAAGQQPGQPLGPGYFTLDPTEQTAALKEAEAFLHKIDSSDLHGAYDSASQLLRNAYPFDNFKSQSDLLRQAFGAFKVRRFDTALKGLGPGPNGGAQLFYYINFRSSYERAALSSDTVTLIKDDAGTYKVFATNVR